MQWLSGIHLQSSRSPASARRALQIVTTTLALPKANYRRPPIDFGGRREKSICANLMCVHVHVQLVRHVTGACAAAAADPNGDDDG